MSRNPDIIFISEYIKNVLYFAIIKSGRVPDNCGKTHYFSIDDDLIYENYYLDFGPLNISCVYKYCKLLNDKINLLSQKQVIIHYTATDPKKKTNAAFLLGCFGILYLSMSADRAFKPLLHGQFMPFQDACPQKSEYTITILDCLDALAKAHNFNFFNFQDFNVSEYIKLDKLQGGDLNWIIPGKFLAFIGPVDNTYSVYHPPEMYVGYFMQNNVKVVIRLNKKLYDSNVFTKSGILHYDLYFPDGSCPQKHIVMKFLEISEQTTGAIAVHCKAGLGRTGTLIGSYLIKHYRMTAHEAIAWMRICRPGSVIGHQQEWLEKIEAWLIKQGNNYRRRMFQDVNRFPKHEFGIYSFYKTYNSRPTLRSPTPQPSNKLSPSELTSALRPSISRRRDDLLKMSRIHKGFSCVADIEKCNEWVKINLHPRPAQQNQTIVTNENPHYNNSNNKNCKVKSGDDCETRTMTPASRLSKHLKSDFVRNGDKANKVQHSIVNQNKHCQLQPFIKISTAQYKFPESKNEPIQSSYSFAKEPKEPPRFRRRLGRSPSPPVTHKINAQESRTRNTLHQSRLSKSSKEKILSQPKVSKRRRGSVGAVSLDAQRSAPVEHRSSSVRSDERPIATQGDFLNSIKFSRRLKEAFNADHCTKTMEKSSMTPLVFKTGCEPSNEFKKFTTKPKSNKGGSDLATAPLQQKDKPSTRSNSPKTRRPALTTFY